MPRYVINRKFEVGEDDMPEVGRRSRRIIEEEFGNVVWIHSHVAVEDDGRVRTFCLYEDCGAGGDLAGTPRCWGSTRWTASTRWPAMSHQPTSPRSR